MVEGTFSGFLASALHHLRSDDALRVSLINYFSGGLLDV
jgi:hypothetical protein